MTTQKQYRGKAELSIVKANGGKAGVYVYAGQPVPAGADQSDIDRLVEEGYLVEVDALGVPVVDRPTPAPPAATPAVTPARTVKA